MNIPKAYEFHDALNDAYYTAEIFKKLNTIPLEPKLYDPAYVVVKPPRQRKREIDYDRLLQQFEKMYARPMTEEEKGIIFLAYKMGKTNQFLKE
jgi:DNA polymerase III epsilon subunit-like protein